MQKGMTFDQAKGCDQAIDGLPNRKTPRSKRPVVLCGRDGQILASRGEYLELRQVTPDTRKMRISLNPLQDLAQDEIGQSEALLIQFPIKPIRVRIRRSPQVFDPDSGIHNSHGAN